MTYRSPYVIPVQVANSRGFKAGENAILDGIAYPIMAVDDLNNTLFLKLPGRRKERRAALKMLQKGAR